MSRFKGTLHVCLLQITGYNTLFLSVEDLRKEVFSSDNQEHEALLLKVRFPVSQHKNITHGNRIFLFFIYLFIIFIFLTEIILLYI